MGIGVGTELMLPEILLGLVGVVEDGPASASVDKGTPVNACSTWAENSKGDDDEECGGEGCSKGDEGTEDIDKDPLLLLRVVIVGVVGNTTSESESNSIS